MIIVSGASGFIGRRLAARLSAQRPLEDLWCLVKRDDDAFGNGGVQFLLEHGVRPVPSDLVTGEGLAGLRRPDVLFHLAANTHTWEADQSCNDLGTRNLLAAVGPLGPRNHVVFTSTVAVMDNRNDFREPLRPDFPPNGSPLTEYGRSKLRAEDFLKAEAARQGFRLSIIRLATVYGPEPKPNSFFAVLKREVVWQSIVSRLNWPGLTSFVHVDDVVDGLNSVASQPPEPGACALHLLGTESWTLRQVAEWLYQARGAAFRVVALPKTAWAFLANAHRLCRGSRGRLPAPLYNWLWRFNLVVNPVLHCDLAATMRTFKDLVPRRMAACIGEI